MGKSGTIRVDGFGTSFWRRTLMLLVLVSVSFSLTTRFQSHPESVTGVHSLSQGLHQHMDRDAVRWAAPVLIFTLLHVPTFYPRVAPAGPPLPTLLFEEQLYNR